MRLKNEYYRLLLIAFNSPEDFVAQITYIDKRGTVTSRAVSPLRLEQGSAKVYCLGRDAIRDLKFERILRVRLRHACDVLSPEGVTELVSHRRRLRRSAG